MSDTNDELFGGSVDRSRLEDMKAAAGDDLYRQAQVAEVQAQVDSVDEAEAAAEAARDEVLAAQPPVVEAEGEESEYTRASAEQAAEDEAPPRAGPGSGKDAWATYAAGQGVEVTDDMTRDDIIAAVDEAQE